MYKEFHTRRGVTPIVGIIVALAVIAGGTVAVKQSNKTKAARADKNKTEQVAGENNATSTAKTIQVDLSTQNNSGQSGKAVLTEVDGKVKVILNITGKPSTVAQPAHIHVSNCATIGAVKYPLTSVTNGASQTTLDVSLDQLVSQLPLSINVHKSAAEASVYVACGDIKAEKKDASSNSAKAVATVSYDGSKFTPHTVNIKKGETVTFINNSTGAMSVATDPHPTHTIYPEFDQYKTAMRGQKEFTFTFDKVGSWKFHNHLNANATGIVTVK